MKEWSGEVDDWRGRNVDVRVGRFFVAYRFVGRPVFGLTHLAAVGLGVAPGALLEFASVCTLRCVAVPTIVFDTLHLVIFGGSDVDGQTVCRDNEVGGTIRNLQKSSTMER